MKPESLVAVILLAAATAAAWRIARRPVRARAVLALGQFALTALLYLTLFPPAGPRPWATLVVLTPGATVAQIQELGPGTALVALPGASAHPDAERVPDLGSALRRRPGTGTLRVVGAGLPARDRDAAAAVTVQFDPAPMPEGIADWVAPYSVRTGSIWRVTGHVRGAGGGRVELVDPGGDVAASGAIAADGAFSLAATARIEGNALYRLRALAADDTAVDEVPLALVVRGGEPMRVLLLAGTPTPESKYLRRWAFDAGIHVAARMGVSPGIAIRDGDVALGAAALREFDLAIVDDRAWGSLASREKSDLVDAVSGGLGLILLGRGTPSRNTASDWAGLGLAAAATESTQSVTLNQGFGLDPRDRLAFARVPLDVDTDDAVPLQSADDGVVLGWMRAYGQGRVALWSLADTYRLTLSGHADRFGTLWARLFATVGRARAAVQPQLPAHARVGERSAICSITADASIAGEPATRLVASAAHTSGQGACAAWWPEWAGWNALDVGGRSWPIHVLAAGEASALAAREVRDATQRLANANRGPGRKANHQAPLSRWPFAAAWLALAALLWWWERHRPAAVPDRPD